GLKFSAHENADRPTELVALSFTRITYLYIMPDGEELFTEYDVEKNVSQSGSNPGGSDPDVDSDKDNMPDWWELEYGFNPGADDSGLDADGDGLTNRQEYELGTNPRSANSIFKASLAPHAEIPGSYRLSWNSVAGKTYVIEWSPDLAQPFTAIRTVKATADSASETVVPTGNVGFYRVRPQ
ncbi:MAG: hypothetical protein ACO3RV_10405, partial [Luteolibacter sp.]